MTTTFTEADKNNKTSVWLDRERQRHAWVVAVLAQELEDAMTVANIQVKDARYGHLDFPIFTKIVARAKGDQNELSKLVLAEMNRTE
jgi:hypothetical protein